MKRKLGHDSITELVGTMILLIIAVSIMAFVYFTVIGSLQNQEEIHVKISGKIQNGVVLLSHNGGENLDMNTQVSFIIAGYEHIKFTLADSEVNIIDGYGYDGKINGLWQTGEILEYNTSVDTDPQIDVRVADINTNELVMYGTLQEGYLLDVSKGGIWHFDECSGLITEDSLNYNTGFLDHILQFTSYP